jgi:acetamidase/formamidase
MSLHTILPESRTLHGRFSRDLAPVLTIDSGDLVRFTTLDAGWGAFEQADPFAPPQKFPRDPRRDPGHALCGPVFVRGAEPGGVLEVRILTVRTGRWGWSGGGGFPTPLNTRLGLDQPPQFPLRWKLDPDRGIATDAGGRTIALAPFPGVIGLAPAEAGDHSTTPPRATGGNIDCRELVAGSTLFLPVAVPGALLSAGDGHAVQGDGEVGQVALECPLETLELEVHVHGGPAPKFPRAETPAGSIAFGFHDDLDEAMALALDNMLDLLTERYDCERKEALAMASLAVSLRVTQVVNRARGVHAILPHGVLDGALPKRTGVSAARAARPTATESR